VSAPAQPRLLLLETSGRVGQVAVAEGDVLRAARRLDEARRHARDLAPSVRDLLAWQGWRPRNVEAVVVGRGPGSYTGLRVGVMSAKAFAYATGCALVAVETFGVIAAQAPPEAERLDVLADAQQGKVYVQGFARAAPVDLPQPATPLRIEPFADWLARRGSSDWATGPGLRGHERDLPPDARVVDPALWDPRPESLLRLGLARYRAGIWDDVWSVEPLYLRPSSAEENWQKGAAAGHPPEGR
jgi:tRNA threonylcarbamoyladenosine biosynthesis protein TsaB